MSQNKEDLPLNWLRRFSRKRCRGREYYFNVKTKEKSWNHPSRNIGKEGVVQWLNKNARESTEDNLTVTVNSSSFQSHQPIVSPQLEEEYKKFEEALAGIEKEAPMNSMNYPTSPSFEDNKSSSRDAYTYAQSMQSTRIAYEQELEEVSGSSYYLVLDTNIFLHEMTFLVNFLNKIDAVPGKPMLVIPYVVLRELDQLKLRTDVTSVSAMQAITFISQQFKMIPNQICGQSAMDDAIHFIEILNANDCIINCCLQLKQIGQRVLLVTNDISLSNKAMCSQIAACDKSEFEAILFRFS